MIPASVPDFKQDYRSLIRYLSTQIRKVGVLVEFGKEATPDSIQEVKPQVVFVATGASPIIPEIPGVEKEKVVTAVDLLLGKKEAKGPFVIVGGGLVGCETALYLARGGERPTVVEVLGNIACDVFTTNRVVLLKLLDEAGVNIQVDTDVLEITNEGVIIADGNGKRDTLKAGTVVLAVGLKPDRRFLEGIQDKVPEVYAIGDCMEPRKVINAIWEGFRTARLI
jgi:2-enoate reductase